MVTWSPPLHEANTAAPVAVRGRCCSKLESRHCRSERRGGRPADWEREVVLGTEMIGERGGERPVEVSVLVAKVGRGERLQRWQSSISVVGKDRLEVSAGTYGDALGGRELELECLR
uniref:Uncharacterized protein n=1 Tax=Oryza meridionalis TaxID=40149 RepID=A0A0E0DPV3_9ORYZ